MSADGDRAEQLARIAAEIEPGMHLCSSDYKAWGDLLEVRGGGEGATDTVLVGRVRASGRAVEVPLSAALEVRGGRCVRLDAPLAEIDERDW